MTAGTVERSPTILESSNLLSDVEGSPRVIYNNLTLTLTLTLALIILLLNDDGDVDVQMMRDKILLKYTYSKYCTKLNFWTYELIKKKSIIGGALPHRYR